MNELRFPDLVLLTTPDLVMQTGGMFATVSDTLRVGSKRRGADLTNKVAAPAKAGAPPSGVCGFPEVVSSSALPWRFSIAFIVSIR